MNRTLLASLALGVALAGTARAVEIAYAAYDVADSVVGEDLWVYEYALDAFPYDEGYGFTVYFDPDLYADLEPSFAANGDWDPIAVEPDANLGEEGFYDAEARVDLPSVGGAFAVTFRWLGAGVPGAQPFEVREPAPSFGSVETGTTLLPEPGSCGLGAAAIAALLATRRSVA